MLRVALRHNAKRQSTSSVRENKSDGARPPQIDRYLCFN